MSFQDIAGASPDLLLAEREILTRIAEGGRLSDVMRDIILLVERPSEGDMLASILVVSDDGKSLLEGAAPSLPAEYNAAIHGIAIGEGVGSCGTAAATGKAIIVTDIANNPLWQDFKDLAIGHGLRACWSMPIEAADGRILGTFANYYREPKEPTARDLEIISMVARTTAIAIERHLNDLARSRAEEIRLLTLRELNHRVKNVFALVDSLMSMGARSATDVTGYSNALRGRLNALSRAHELVQPGLFQDPADSRADVPLHEIVGEIVAPYLAVDATERVSIEGETIRISPHAITGISLILHELATNAAKYGSLSQPQGRLAISWDCKDALEINWRESGGPPSSAPSRTGFGTTLIQRTVELQFSGSISKTWETSGLTVRIRIPRENVVAHI